MIEPLKRTGGGRSGSRGTSCGLGAGRALSTLVWRFVIQSQLPFAIGLALGILLGVSAPVTGAAAHEQASVPEAKKYDSCKDLRASGWTRGVREKSGTCRDEWDKAEKRTYWLNTARDGDGDGHACERVPVKRQVVYGLGVAASYFQDSRRRVTAAAADGSGILRATALRNERIRPVALAAYLRPLTGTVRWGRWA